MEPLICCETYLSTLLAVSNDCAMRIQMFRSILLIATALVTILLSSNVRAEVRSLKILHTSLHAGCIKDIEEVGRALGLNITPWLIQKDRPRIAYDGEEKLTNDIYNITPERAKKIWELNQEYFDQFDAVITSDTAPLSRIFLQNGWKKPLIIWVCNRFDYADGETAQGRFPDAEYYDLFRAAAAMPNVRIISYTPYEHVYARRKGVEIGTLTINPVGRLPLVFNDEMSAIPRHVSKADTIFLFPRLENQAAVDLIQAALLEKGIATYHGAYNGPEDLAGFKGVLYFPYAWSNLALFENLQQGIVHFVPSEKFVERAKSPIRVVTSTEFELCDWWAPEFREHLVYFDSFEDLQQKIENTNYDDLKQQIRRAGASHRANMLERWRQVIEGLGK